MSKQGRASFGRRKRKRPELEPVPVIVGEDVEVTKPPRERTQTEPTEASVTHDPDKLGLLPEQALSEQRPSTVITPETGEVSPMAGIPRAFTREHTEEPVVIRGYDVGARPVKVPIVPEVAESKIVGEVTGRGSLIEAAYTPPETKDGKKIIRG